MEGRYPPNMAEDQANELNQLEDKLLWYLRHQDEVLDYRHRFLAQYTPEDVGRWSRATRRARLASLNNARNFYEKQAESHQANQSTIMDWFDRYIKLRSGRMILRSQYMQKQEPLLSEEFEFEE